MLQEDFVRVMRGAGLDVWGVWQDGEVMMVKVLPSFQLRKELPPRRRLEGAVLQGMGVLLPPCSASLHSQVEICRKCCLQAGMKTKVLAGVRNKLQGFFFRPEYFISSLFSTQKVTYRKEGWLFSDGYKNKKWIKGVRK